MVMSTEYLTALVEKKIKSKPDLTTFFLKMQLRF